MIKYILITFFCLFLLTNCGPQFVLKDFEDLVLCSTDTTNNRVNLTNNKNIPVLEKYNFHDDKSYLELVLDLKNAQTFRLIENILRKNIEAYIVIKDHKGQDIARHKIILFDADSIEITEERRNAFTGRLKYFNRKGTTQRFTYNDTIRYLPQYVFINDALVSEDEVYALYIQGNLWKENETTLINICSSPKFISIESNETLVCIDEYFDISFFVTGYYRPTTGENLVDLELKIREGLVELPIKNITQMDRNYVLDIELAFDTLYKNAQKCFEKYVETKRTEHLLMEFIGRTDPRSISTKYLEETVEFLNNDKKFPDIRIESGVTMDNMILSQLRAYYTWKYVDTLFLKSIQYQKLKKQGRIHFRVVGEGPAEDTDMGKARRVDVRIKRISQS